jgi:poly-gamma-glutamate synthesis protein (capsule biosynthesis protein)
MSNYNYFDYITATLLVIVFSSGALSLAKEGIPLALENMSRYSKVVKTLVKETSQSASLFLANARATNQKEIPNVPFVPYQEVLTGLLKEEEISLVFVGDIMLDRGVEGSVRRAGGDYTFAFAHVSSLKEADLLFGNLEGPISDKGQDRHNLYSFRFAPESLKALIDAGFDVLSIANNHIGDWGREAFTDTISRLENGGIVPVGDVHDTAGDTALKTFRVKNTTFGFLGFTDVGPNWLGSGSLPQLAIASPEKVETLVKKHSPRVDYLIVSFHFGNEYEEAPSARQKLLAQTAINSGAQLVIGHHPHVIQPIEKYKDGLIAYSLGNFVFDQNFSDETMEGRVLEVVVKNKKTDTYYEHLIKHNRQFQPALVPVGTFK